MPKGLLPEPLEPDDAPAAPEAPADPNPDASFPLEPPVVVAPAPAAAVPVAAAAAARVAGKKYELKHFCSHSVYAWVSAEVPLPWGQAETHLVVSLAWDWLGHGTW